MKDKLEEALCALHCIKARINGNYDDPLLMAYGPLQTKERDILYIIEVSVSRINKE